MEAQYQRALEPARPAESGLGGGMGEPPNPRLRAGTRAPGPAGREPTGRRKRRIRPDRIERWLEGIAGQAGCTIVIDAANPHSGQGSLRLTAPAAPASVISSEFVPSSASSMMIQAYLRPSRRTSRSGSGSRARPGDSPISAAPSSGRGRPGNPRRSGPPDLPAGGLDSARLWIRDAQPGHALDRRLHVIGEATPKAVRLNAQRTLLAALQAYRAQHYAEFARLSSSHWARHPSILAASRSTRPTRAFRDSRDPRRRTSRGFCPIA